MTAVSVRFWALLSGSHCVIHYLIVTRFKRLVKNYLLMTVWLT